MLLTVSNYLNARTPMSGTLPSVHLSNPYYHPPGKVLQITDTFIGQLYNGSAVWYLVDDGQYYWSGGFFETSFQIDGAFNKLIADQKFALINECATFFSSYFKKLVPEFTGLFSSFKNGAPCLTISAKSITPGIIPPSIDYKGFEIPIDFIIEDVAHPISIGSSIDSETGNVGTAGFFFSVGNQNYMVTNYHVVCKSLIIQKKFSYDKSRDGGNIKVRMPANGNIIGEVAFGMLDSYKDFAVVKIGRKFQNSVQGFSFNGIYSLAHLSQNFQPGKHLVEMLGSSVGFNSTNISSLNTHIPLTYFNSIPFHLYGLIQTPKITQPGDSGSPVIKNKQLFGLMVAESDTFSYIISIGNILPEIRQRLNADITI